MKVQLPPNDATRSATRSPNVCGRRSRLLGLFDQCSRLRSSAEHHAFELPELTQAILEAGWGRRQARIAVETPAAVICPPQRLASVDSRMTAPTSATVDVTGGRFAGATG